MNDLNQKKSPLSLKQRLLLVVVAPCCMLLFLEGAARVALVLGVGAAKPKQPMQLEMPTWMLQDANAVARAAPSADAIDWLNLFKEGNGFRVNLAPNISHFVKNTFSLIPADRDQRYLIQSNSLGFRSPELMSEKAPNTFRIAVFGDSSSFGWGVNAEDSWSALLRSQLQGRFPGKQIELVNFAIPGDSSAYGRLLFDTFAAKAKADLVILGFGANDAKGVFTSHTEQVARFQGKAGLVTAASWFRLSAMYRLLETALAPRPGPPALNRKRVPAVAPSDYVSNLSYMATRNQELGGQNSLLLTLCTPNSYARRARTLARQSNFLWFNGQAQLIKALPQIQAGKLYPEYVQRMTSRYPEDLARNRFFYITSDGCHPNELGHRFVADRLTDIVSRSALLQ
jgi:lysophospholipase L1-like esterase